ncbi:hypothetical protein [Rufibacter soli]
MQKRILGFGLCLVAWLWTTPGLSQQVAKTLVLQKNQIYEVGPTNALLLDTLIMADNSSLRFLPEAQGILVVKTVIIGKNCLINAAGKSGAHGRTSGSTSFDGQNGGSLAITMHFSALANLTIDTRGGNGTYGKDGRNGKDGIPERVTRNVSTNAQGKPIVTLSVEPGVPAIPATAGTAGGKAGKGGDIALTYGSSDFIINFNHTKANHHILLLNGGGRPGKPGKPGRQGRSYDKMDVENAKNNHATPEMVRGQDGQVTLTKLPGQES